jgi:DNA-binding NarL/FixJ family response regulator
VTGATVTGPAAVRVVVVDDHPLFRQGIGALIRDSPETELAGAGASGEEAVALCAQLEPDVVVMDVHMPGLGGVEATRQILRARPQTAIVMLTMMDEDDSVFAAMRAGARGYVLKGSQPAEILRAVVAVASGQAIFGRDVAARMAGYFAEAGQAGAARPFGQLTAREREILELMAAGAGNGAIAARLGLTEKTIRNNVSSIFVKLGVSDRAAAVARARDAGIRPRPLPSPSRAHLEPISSPSRAHLEPISSPSRAHLEPISSPSRALLEPDG